MPAWNEGGPSFCMFANHCWVPGLCMISFTSITFCGNFYYCTHFFFFYMRKLKLGKRNNLPTLPQLVQG